LSVVAEQVTTGPLRRLGPAEFRNMSYLTSDGWQPVQSLTAYVGCAVNTPCTMPNPYGVTSLGPNDIIAGSGVQKHANGEILWPQSNSTVALLPPVAILVTFCVIIYLPIWYLRRLHGRRQGTELFEPANTQPICLCVRQSRKV
jgi:hypothetical protein